MSQELIDQLDPLSPGEIDPDKGVQDTKPKKETNVDPYERQLEQIDPEFLDAAKASVQDGGFGDRAYETYNTNLNPEEYTPYLGENFTVGEKGIDSLNKSRSMIELKSSNSLEMFGGRLQTNDEYEKMDYNNLPARWFDQEKR